MSREQTSKILFTKVSANSDWYILKQACSEREQVTINTIDRSCSEIWEPLEGLLDQDNKFNLAAGNPCPLQIFF